MTRRYLLIRSPGAETGPEASTVLPRTCVDITVTKNAPIFSLGAWFMGITQNPKICEVLPLGFQVIEVL